MQRLAKPATEGRITALLFVINVLQTDGRFFTAFSASLPLYVFNALNTYRGSARPFVNSAA